MSKRKLSLAIAPLYNFTLATSLLMHGTSEITGEDYD